MKRIMVTTDFSHLADQALAPAGDLARRLGAELILLHVLGAERPPRPDPDAPYYTVAQRLYEADAELEAQALASLKERGRPLDGVDWRPLVARGETVEGILDVAEREQVDLIVTCSQGRTGFKRLLLGSVAEELARVSPVPVLIWKGVEEE